MMKRLVWVIFFVFLAFSQAKAFNLMGDWRYTDSSSEEGGFSQIYSFSISSQATNTINIGSTLRYSRNNQGSEYRELLTPTAFLSLRNDYFNLNLSATDTERHDSEGPDFSSRSWNADFSSFYKKLINTRIYYGGSKEKDNRSPQVINNKNNYWGATLIKSWQGFDFYYDYRGSHGEDYIDRSKTNNFSNLLKLNYSGSWRRLSYNLGEQFNYVKNKWEGRIENGKAKYPINISVQWLPSDWQTQVANNAIYTDPSCFNSYIELVKNADPNQDPDYGIVIDLGTEEIGYLEFYYNSVNWKAIPTDIKWDIYYSSDRANWVLLAEDVSLPYDFSGALSLNFSGARYLKLIPRTQYSQDLILESPLFKAYKYITSSQYKSLIHAYRTDVSFSYSLTDNINILYSFSSDRTEPTPGPDSKDTIHSFSASWFVNKYFQPNLTFSQAKNLIEAQPTILVKNFSISNFSDIFSTLNLSASFTHTLLEEGGIKKSRNDILNLNTIAKIFPDLDVRWDISYGDNYSYENNKNTKTFYSRVNAIARIKPSITLNTIYQFDYTSTGDRSDIGNYLLLDLSWTFSDFCSFHGSESIHLDDETSINSVYSLWFSLTPNTQINFQYSGVRNNTNVDQFSSFFSWRINKHLSFKSNYSWSKIDGLKTWSWMVNLTSIF